MTRAQHCVLSRLLGDTTTFAEQHWGIAPLHLGQTDDTFDDVFSLETFEQWLIASPRRPTVRMVAAGVNLAPSRYCKPTRLGPDTFTDVVNLDRVVDCLNDGATLVAQSLHRVFFPIVEYAASLQAELSHRVQVNAYLTPPSATGLRPHSDGHDVVALQLHGTKVWNVEGLGEVTMQPGNRLYIPRGVEHSAATNSGHSLHLTIGIHAVTYRQLAMQALADHEGLDRPLPFAYHRMGPAEVADLTVMAIAEAHDALSRHDPADRTREVPQTRPGVSHRLRSALAADDLGPATMFEANAGIELTRKGAGDIQLRRPGGIALHLPQYVEDSLLRILSGPTASIDLPDLDPESQLVLSRRLLRDGFVHLCDRS